MAEPLPDPVEGLPSRIRMRRFLALFLGVVVADVAIRRDSECLEIVAEEIRPRSRNGGLEVCGEKEVLQRDVADHVGLRGDGIAHLEPVENLLAPVVRVWTPGRSCWPEDRRPARAPRARTSPTMDRPSAR